MFLQASVCPQGGGAWSRGGAWSWGEVSAPRGWCLVQEGCLVPGGVCLGSCSKGVSAPGGAWSWGGLLLGGVCSQGVGIPACTEADPLPRRDGYCCGWYASYWNAFLFVVILQNLGLRLCAGADLSQHNLFNTIFTKVIFLVEANNK